MGSNQAAVSYLTNLARSAFGLGVGATLLTWSLYTVDGGQRAVLFDRFRGVLDETIGKGTHFLVPWLQRPFIFDIRTRPHTFSSPKTSKWRWSRSRSRSRKPRGLNSWRAAIIRAEGESESAKLISDATAAAGMGLIELRRIEASREIAATLAKTPNVAYLPSGNNLLLGLNPSLAPGR
ncbi:hypothetical protein HHK36_015763 [Tetracentron sinense]|uniref:Prohibitin n=1 Tax=Tetracentron sinense TaxID=13715 RepID=A0A834Z7T7_TETSI|nr:hypothetical protein HHK36_015763 [Tetracentron sinense]